MIDKEYIVRDDDDLFNAYVEEVATYMVLHNVVQMIIKIM